VGNDSDQFGGGKKAIRSEGKRGSGDKIKRLKKGNLWHRKRSSSGGEEREKTASTFHRGSSMTGEKEETVREIYRGGGLLGRSKKNQRKVGITHWKKRALQVMGAD